MDRVLYMGLNTPIIDNRRDCGGYGLWGEGDDPSDTGANAWWASLEEELQRFEDREHAFNTEEEGSAEKVGSQGLREDGTRPIEGELENEGEYDDEEEEEDYEDESDH